MSKRQIIKELALEVETARRDYESVVKQRNWAEREMNSLQRQRDNVAAAKKEAAIQEKVDGIRAGLIPTSELRKAFDTLTVDTDGVAFVTYSFDRNGDRIQKAISDALTAKPKAKIGKKLFGDAATISTYPLFGGLTIDRNLIRKVKTVNTFVH